MPDLSPKLVRAVIQTGAQSRTVMHTQYSSRLGNRSFILDKRWVRRLGVEVIAPRLWFARQTWMTTAATDSETPENGKPPYMELFFLSLASLIVELLIIRWISADIRAFTIFKTFPLVTCFVGLGVGTAQTSHQRQWCRATFALRR